MSELMFETGYASSKPHSWRVTRTCVVCGESFIPKTANQKCCCKDCSAIHNAGYKEQKNKEYWAKNSTEINEKRKNKDGHPTDYEGRHVLTKAERMDRNKRRLSRKQNMEEIIRISVLSNGDYGRWVAVNDR